MSSGDGGSESLQIADYGDSRDLTDDRSNGLRRSFDRIARLFSRSKDCQMMSARLPTNQTQILTNLSQFWLTSRSVATTGLSASSREPFQSEASSAAVCWPGPVCRWILKHHQVHHDIRSPVHHRRKCISCEKLDHLLSSSTWPLTFFCPRSHFT